MQKRKYRMMKQAGALQEGVQLGKSRKKKPVPDNYASNSFSLSEASLSNVFNDIPEIAQEAEYYSDYVEAHDTGVHLLSSIGPPVIGTQRAPVPQMAQQMLSPQRMGGEELRTHGGASGEYAGYVSSHQTSVGLTAFGGQASGPMGAADAQADPSLDALAQFQDLDHMEVQSTMGLFFYTVAEGQRVLVLNRDGKGELLDGPVRVWRPGKKFIPLSQHVAYPGEFLIIRHLDGSQRHQRGPCKQWFDPRKHAKVEKEDVLQLAAKEAVVVYFQENEEDEDSIQRRIVMGPAVFMPQPGEWLHTFCWHGSRDDGYKKYPGALRFQKLWLMPDQMYHDVEDVRTADDVVLTVRLMIFFELKDVERMLDGTHDPIGDFINAASSDVLDLVGRVTFDVFKTRTDQLNELSSYSQLISRASQVGYEVKKIVYRGYSTTAALQSMHDQAIETRTRLKLEKETENQAQELSDFKQQREFERSDRARGDKKLQKQHDLEVKQQQHDQDIRLMREEWEARREQNRLDVEQELSRQQQLQEQKVAFLEKLQDMGVELTEYLTQARADQVIEVRGEQNKVSPHLHLPEQASSKHRK